MALSCTLCKLFVIDKQIPRKRNFSHLSVYFYTQIWGELIHQPEIALEIFLLFTNMYAAFFCILYAAVKFKFENFERKSHQKGFGPNLL